MIRFLTHISPSLWADRRAITNMEYGMIAAIIIVAIVSGVAAIGKGLPIAFNTISSAM